MKWIFIFYFVIFSHTAFSATGTNHITISPIMGLAMSMCKAMVPGTNDPYIIQGVKQEVVNYMNKNGNSNPGNLEIVNFLNKYRHQLICRIDNKPKHYMKYAIDRRAHSDIFIGLFIEDLMEDQDKIINVNAISENSAGNPETVLDYLDHLLHAGHFPPESDREMREFRKMLYEDFGARNHENLSDEEKSNYLKGNR
jgi:hypothetical protein